MRHRNRSIPQLPAASTSVCLALVPSSAAAAGGAIEILPDPLTLAILIVGFLLLIYPVNVLLFRPLIRVLDEREERIAGARERAQKLEEEASAILGRYESEVRATREGASAERRRRTDAARREEFEATAAARAEAEREFERARSEIDAALRAARAGLGEQAEELARQAAHRILGRELW